MAYGDMLRLDLAVNLKNSGVDSEQWAAEWMQSSLQRLFPDLHASLKKGPVLNSAATRRDDVPWGEPGGIWAGIFVQREEGGRERLTLYSGKSWSDFISQLDRIPFSSRLNIRRLNGQGYPLQGVVRINIYRVRRNADWVRFDIELSNAFSDWVNSHRLQSMWISFMIQWAERMKCSIGSIASDNVGEQTALEVNLGYSPSDTIPHGQSALRGYSWVTLCDGGLASRLGGPSALANSGAFVKVKPLDHGALLLQATETYAEYDADAVQRVFRALAPILLTGKTELIPGYEYLKIANGVDAADFR